MIKNPYPYIPDLCHCGCGSIVYHGIFKRGHIWRTKKPPGMSGKIHTKESRIRMKENHKDFSYNKNPRYGRFKYPKRGVGIPISKKNPYSEKTVLHHPDPNLPFVVPCPERLHKIFHGNSHYENVNFFLGIIRIGS